MPYKLGPNTNSFMPAQETSQQHVVSSQLLRSVGGLSAAEVCGHVFQQRTSYPKVHLLFTIKLCQEAMFA